MNTKREKYSSSFFFSLLLHVIVIVALIASFDWNAKMAVLQNSDKNSEVINARVITSVASPKKLLHVPPKVIPKPPAAQPVKPEVVKSAPVKPNPQPTAKSKPETKPQPVPIPTKPVIAISDKKEKQLQQEKIAQQMLADIKKQASMEKKIKQKAIAAEFEKELKQMAAKSLQQDMLQEQKKMAGARSQQVRGEVNKFKALILQTISQNWLIPPSVNKDLFAELMIRVAPGGVVLDVQIIKSSGDQGLDHSAQSTVFKSSPLPVPKDADAFEPFRQFVLKVKPKDILNSENWES